MMGICVFLRPLALPQEPQNGVGSSPECARLNRSPLPCCLQKSELETFLSSCPEAKGAGVTFQYLNEADDVYAYLVTSELTDLPPLPVLPDATSDEVCTSDTEDSTEGEEMEDC
jgi:hypothetical protein